MKKLLIALTLLSSLSAFASSLSYYECTTNDMLVGVPSRISFDLSPEDTLFTKVYDTPESRNWTNYNVVTSLPVKVNYYSLLGKNQLISIHKRSTMAKLTKAGAEHNYQLAFKFNGKSSTYTFTIDESKTQKITNRYTNYTHQAPITFKSGSIRITGKCRWVTGN